MTLKQTDSEKYIEQAFKEINKLADRNQLVKATKLCEGLFELYPEHPRVLHGIGLLRYRTGDLEDGELKLRKALDVKPDFADCHYNYGRMLANTLRFDEAENEFRISLSQDPDHFKALTALASVLIKNDQWDAALLCCQRSLVLNPDFAPTYAAMANIMLTMGKTTKAIELNRKCLKISKIDSVHSSLLFALNAVPAVTQKDIYDESLKWGERYAKPFYKKIHGYLNIPNPDRKIRIGYVSGDFRQHPIANFLKPVLVSHDKHNFEVYLYNTCSLIDKITEEIAGYADNYRDVSVITDEQAAVLIRQDCIDILVDLSGHTAFNRLYLFAMKLAPVQVSWQGYFNTTGIAAIDYLLSDPVTIPFDEERYFVEKIIKLPDCRFCYTPPDFSPDIVTAPVLNTGHITFGSFNAVHKINPELIALWCQVLNAVTHSRMVLKSKVFIDNKIVEDFRSQFALHGITADRLDLRSRSPYVEMLAEYGDIDITLDTFPFNGGATTCEALWMGVPVITLEGNTPISRQSKSFMYAVGYPEWVASTPGDFVAIASRLAADVIGMQLVRASLRQKMSKSSLCDTKLFTQNLEALYRQIWQKWCYEQPDFKFTSLKKFTVDELFSAGVASLKDNDTQRAVQLFRKVLSRRPGHAEASNNLGVSLKRSGEYSQSLKAFRKAIRHDPMCLDAYVNLGCAYLDKGDFSRAEKIFHLGLRIAPDNCDLLVNLGVVYRLMSRLDKSRVVFEQVLRIDKQNLGALSQMALVRSASGDMPSAIEFLRTALEIEPENSTIISALVALLLYMENTQQEEVYLLSRKFGNALDLVSPSKNNFSSCRVDCEQLRIGFVSADFKNHPVGMLLVSLFKEYNTSRLSFYCYNNGSKSDNLTNWFQSVSCGWHDIFGMEDDAVSTLIRNDGIDILVDLSGHTSWHRLSLFNKRQAPVQVTWMGYSHTTGLSTMDYIIADNYFIYPKDEQWFTERVAYLPHNRFCFTPPPPYPEVTELPYEDNGYITFGSFNNIAKFSEQVVAVWARILHEVPNSRLILKYKAFNDVTVRKNICNRFRLYGISSRRLDLRTASNMYFMMAEYGDIDIALDPFPFTGGMTSLLSLWMGVPVITLSGELPISRQTKSFLTPVGLSDLAVENYDEYIACAVALAKDTVRLKGIRGNLRETMSESSLCDAKEFAQSIENLFFKLWHDTCSDKEV